MTTRVAPSPPAAAVEAFGASLPTAVAYAEMLCTLGVERGLLGPREPERIWSRHLLNSAALAPLIAPSASVVDLGSGAGLPGIPLLLVRPDLVLTLVEPMERRAAFLQECVVALDLPARVRRCRAEELPPASAQVVVVRAVAPLERLLGLALPLLGPGGELLALKGRRAEEEVAAADRALRRWPTARVSLDQVGSGEETVTVVRVHLDSGTKGREA